VGQDAGKRVFVTKMKPLAHDWGAVLERYRGDLVAEGVPAEEAAVEAARRVERMKLRMAWFEERFQAFIDAQDRVGDYYVNYADDRPEIDWDDEDAPDIPEPEALQAVVDALYAEIDAARQGRWPRHLHFAEV
jgi:hypothetical protein